MIRRMQPAQDGHGNLDRWLLTYADMITLLTAFFLMLYSMSVMSKGKFQQVAAAVRTEFGGKNGKTGASNGSGYNGVLPDPAYVEYQVAMANLAKYVEQHHLGGKVKISSDERGEVITLLSDGVLFKSGQAHLQPAAVPLLMRVASVLKPLPNNVLIEGHTDNKPIHTVLFPSNWELSASRAAAVLRELVYSAGLTPSRFSAAGYADTRPVGPNDTPHERAQNRRVDIVILKTRLQKQADLLRQAELQRVETGSGN